jgi:hypothetical protein
MLNKQTAVDIFHNRVNELIKEKKTITTFVIDGIWLECKEMEKDRMIDFTRKAVRKILDENRQNPFNLEQYYNETYGGSNK